MDNFVFRNPTKLIVGKGTIAHLRNEIPKEKRILITYGGGSVLSNGVMDQVDEALKEHPFVMKAGGIEVNPDLETLMPIVELAKENQIDFLLAVGGGSVADGTKFIAHAIHYEGDPWDIVADGSVVNQSTPLAIIITLPATGSEMNQRGVISWRKMNKKQGFYTDHSFPQFSILDPQVCYSLPRKQIANGVVDSFMHVSEQYMTHSNQSLVMERWAEGILATLIEVGPKVIEEPTNYDYMSNYMLSATLALNDMIGMGVIQDWAAHRIGYELTIYYNLAHAETLAVIYPALLREMKPYKQERLAQFAVRVLGKSKTTEESVLADQAIDFIESFFRSMGLRTRLSEYGLTEKDLAFIEEKWVKRDFKLGEEGRVTPEVGKRILQRCK